MTIKELIISVKYELDQNSFRRIEDSINKVRGNVRNMGDKIKSAMTNSKASVNDFANSTGGARDSINSMAEAAIAAQGVFATLFAVDKVKRFAAACVSVASDTQQMREKFAISYGNLASDAEKQAKEYADRTGRNVIDTMTRMADAQDLISGYMGMEVAKGIFSEEEANQASSKIAFESMALANDLATFSNKSEEQAFQAIQRAISGEYESLRLLGVTLRQDTVVEYAKLLGFGKDKYKDLTEWEKIQATFAGIRGMSPNAIGAENDFRNYDWTKGNTVKEAQLGSLESVNRQLGASKKDFQAVFGDVLIPLMTITNGVQRNLYDGLTKLAKTYLITADGGSVLALAIDTINKRFEALKPIVDRIKTSFKDFIKPRIEDAKKLIDSLGGLQRVLEPIIVAFGSFFLIGAGGTFVKNIMRIGSMLMGIPKPILLIAAAITAAYMVVMDILNFLNGNASVSAQVFERLGLTADDVREGLFRAYEVLQNFVGLLMDKLGGAVTQLQPVLANMFNAFVDALPGIVEQATQFIDIINQTVEGFGGWERVLPILGKILLGFMAFKSIGGIFNTLSGAIGKILAPVDLIRGGISKIAGEANGLSYLTKFVSDFGKANAGASIFDAFKFLDVSKLGGISKVIADIGSKAGGFVKVLGGIGKFAAPILGVAAVVTLLTTAVVSFFDFMKGNNNGLLGKVFQMLGMDCDATRESIKQAITDVVQKVVFAVRTIITWVKDHSEQIKATVKAVVTAIAAVVKALVTIISAIIGAIIAIIVIVVRTIIDIWSVVGPAVMGVITPLIAFFGKAFEDVMQIIKGVADFIKAVFTLDFAGAINAAKEIVGGFVMLFIDKFTTIIEIVHNVINSIADGFKSLISSGPQWMQDFVGGMIDGFVTAAEGLVESVQGVAGKIREYLHFSRPDVGPLRDYEKWMPDMIIGMRKGIITHKGRLIGEVQKMARDVNGEVVNLFGGSPTMPISTGISTVNRGIANNTTKTVVQNNTFNNSYTGVQNGAEKITSAMKQSSKDATSELANGLAFARG